MNPLPVREYSADERADRAAAAGVAFLALATAAIAFTASVALLILR